jgi:PAS domain S-box-containing protein
LYISKILYILGTIYPLVWFLQWLYDSSYPIDTGARLLIFFASFITGYLIQTSSSKSRVNLIYFGYILLISITYHSILVCYLTFFKVEYIALSFLVIFLTSISIMNKNFLITYLIATSIGQFISASFSMPRQEFIHFIIPSILSLFGIFIIQNSKIKDRKFNFPGIDFFNEIIAKNEDGIIITDSETRILFLNTKAKNYINPTLDEDFILLSKVVFPIPEIDQILGNPKIISLENNIYLEIQYSKVEYQTDYCYLIRLKDKTKEKKLEEEFNRMFSIQEDILNYGNIGIIYLDNEGYVVYINKHAQELLNMNDSEIIGETFQNKVHHSNIEGLTYDEDTFPVKMTYTEGKSFHIPLDIFWKKNGNYFYVEYESSPIIKNNKILGAIVLFKDISLKKANDDLDKQYRDELLHLSNTSNRFLEIYTYSELFRFIAEEISIISNNSATIVNSYDEELNIFTVQAHTGFKSYFNELHELIGRDFKGLYYKIEQDDPVFQLNTEDHLYESLSDGLVELKFGNLNRKICKSIEFIVGTKNVFSITLFYKDIFFGNIIILSNEVVLKNKTMIEVFQNQASINLYRKYLEKNLNKDKFRLDPVILNTSILYCELKLDGTIYFINPELEKVLEYKNEEIIGKNWWGLIQTNLKYDEIQLIIKNMKNESLLNFKSEITTKKNIKLQITWDWIYKYDSDTGNEIITGLGKEIYFK